MRTALTRAERQAQTRGELLDAAHRLFTAKGFHATSIDAVAAEAGFTKGAVYSNFASKEDLFLAVYERRVDARVAEIEAILEGAPTLREGIERIIPGNRGRSERDDGWMAVFFEFWAHALRHPPLRERFAAQHRRIIDLLAAAMVESGQELPDDPHKLATARYAMQLGLQLERLTQPDLVDERLGVRMGRLMDEGGLDGLPDQAPAGRGARDSTEQGAGRA